MVKLDTHSDTWRQLCHWANEQRQGVVDQLIAGTSHDDQLRGRIEQIDELLSLADEPEPPIPSPEY